MKTSLKQVQNLISAVREFWDCTNWHSCMDDPDIAIQEKFLINGTRHIYTSFICDSIARSCNKRQELVLIFPTGSNNVSSDIDVQVCFNLCADTSQKQLRSVISIIEKTLNSGQIMWGIRDALSTLLDINFYPGTLINFTSDFACLSNGCVYKGVDGRTVCFRPKLNTKAQIQDFVYRDFGWNRNHPDYEDLGDVDMSKYYSIYKSHIIPNIVELWSACGGDITNKNNVKRLIGSAFNDLLFEIVRFNKLADEVYLSISSIILVVWHMQMGNKLPIPHLSILAVNAFIEQYEMYKNSEKEKYHKRMMYAASKMDMLLLEGLSKKYYRIAIKMKREEG